jgi:hypothetical protein
MANGIIAKCQKQLYLFGEEGRAGLLFCLRVATCDKQDALDDCLQTSAALSAQIDARVAGPLRSWPLRLLAPGSEVIDAF